jgi:hypothetical protein
LKWNRAICALAVAVALVCSSAPASAEELSHEDYEAIQRLINIDIEARKGNTDAAEDLVRLTFPEDPDTAVRIARRESGLRCDADNPTSSASGIMQLMSIHAPRANRMGVTWWEVQYSCLANLTVARAMYDEGGWRPWRV